MKLTYAGSGVDYDALDGFKREAQRIAVGTAHNIERIGGGMFSEFQPSRGESAYLIETSGMFIAHVEEGLGTKSLVADEMQAFSDRSFYDQVAICTVAMIVNDMATVGALPLSVAMHVATGDSGWFKNERRAGDLIYGWEMACNQAGCSWGCGETPTLKGVVNPETVVLSGSAVGVICPKGRLISSDSIEAGDAIVLVESSGIHANGLTLARKIADKLSDGHKSKMGYRAKLSDGRTYGEALLDPTRIYVRLVEGCFDEGVNIHYAVNITGHGWRKLMRAVQPFTYVIEQLPTQLPIFDFIQQNGPVDDQEAYGNLNMGAGFALYVAQGQADKVCEVAERCGFRAFVAGYIEAGSKKVIIKPKGIEFCGETLAVR